jgi:hypothetical protein
VNHPGLPLHHSTELSVRIERNLIGEFPSKRGLRVGEELYNGKFLII